MTLQEAEAMLGRRKVQAFRGASTAALEGCMVNTKRVIKTQSKAKVPRPNLQWWQADLAVMRGELRRRQEGQ